MAVVPSQSTEIQTPKPQEAPKPKKEEAVGNRYAQAKVRVTNFATDITGTLKDLLRKKATNVNLEPEAKNIQTLSEELKNLEQRTEERAQVDVQSTTEAPDTQVMQPQESTSIAKREVADQDRQSASAREETTGLQSLIPEDYTPFPEESVRYVFEQPDGKTYATITFDSKRREGDELNPTQRILYQIPPEYQGRVIRDVILKHRKDPSRFQGDQKGWDTQGAYSRVLVKDAETGEWKSWNDPTGYKSDKFAEPRSASDPENEVLHDWIATVGEVKPTIISVENIGNGESAISNVHGLEVVFFPETEEVVYDERVFSPGTAFIDLKKDIRLPTYGGGKKYGGKYPGAVALGSWGSELQESGIDYDATKTVYMDVNGRLHIKLQPGRKFVGLEVAVGDTHPDDKINKQGGTGTLGWAKLYAGLRSMGQEGEYFMKHVNVPPTGVLAGAPKQAGHVVGNEEELIIESWQDTSYLMGYRIAYKE